jgi:hypothetical protein
VAPGSWPSSVCSSTVVLPGSTILWLLNLCFAPMCALMLEGLHPLNRRVPLLPRASQDVRRHNTLAHRRETVASSALSSVRIRAKRQLPSAQSTPLQPLGTYLGGELDAWVYGGQLCVPLEALSLHGTGLGEPGFDKTITLLGLATIAARYGMQVIYLDLKGSPKTAAQFVATMRYVGLERLNAGWLKRAYDGKSHWNAQRTLRKVQSHINATSLAYDGFFAAADGGLDGTFALEDGDAVYIGLDGSALREQTAGIGRYVLEDCAHSATARKQASVRALMIIDEFGVLKTSNAANHYERVREAGMAMWAAAQSYHGLGAERASVLSASSIKIVHRCGEPEEVVKFGQ